MNPNASNTNRNTHPLAATVVPQVAMKTVASKVAMKTVVPQVAMKTVVPQVAMKTVPKVGAKTVPKVEKPQVPAVVGTEYLSTMPSLVIQNIGSFLGAKDILNLHNVSKRLKAEMSSVAMKKKVKDYFKANLILIVDGMVNNLISLTYFDYATGDVVFTGYDGNFVFDHENLIAKEYAKHFMKGDWYDCLVIDDSIKNINVKCDSGFNYDFRSHRTPEDFQMLKI